ncbi:hypothetical protein GN956_G7270 [Arapaima gigas]
MASGTSATCGVWGTRRLRRIIAQRCLLPAAVTSCSADEKIRRQPRVCSPRYITVTFTSTPSVTTDGLNTPYEYFCRPHPPMLPEKTELCRVNRRGAGTVLSGTSHAAYDCF